MNEYPDYPLTDHDYPTEADMNLETNDIHIRGLVRFENPNDWIINPENIGQLNWKDWKQRRITVPTVEELIDQLYSLNLFLNQTEEDAREIAADIAKQANRHTNTEHFQQPTIIEYEAHCDYFIYQLEELRTPEMENLLYHSAEIDRTDLLPDLLTIYTEPFNNYTAEHFFNVWKEQHERTD